MVRILMAALALMLLSGCTISKRITTEIDALSAPNVSTNIAVYIAPDEDTTPGLQFDKFASYAKTALTRRGFSVVDSPNQAQATVLLSYGTGDAQQHQYTYTQPVYGETGIESSRTVKETVKDEEGNKVTRERTIYEPRYGVVGHSTHIGSYTTWPMRVRLRAIKDDKEQWVTVAVSNDTTNDLRQILPAMLYVAMPYIANSTKQKIELTLKLDDPQLILFKEQP